MNETPKRKPGRPATGKRKQTFNISLDPELISNLDEIANTYYMSRSALVGQVLSDFVRNNKQ